MARERIQDRQVLQSGQNRDGYKTAVQAKMVDPGRLEDPAYDELGALAQGLSQLSPSLARYTEVRNDNLREEGRSAAATGQALDPDSPEAKAQGYMSMTGEVRALQDADELVAKFENEFDKETGNVEDFIAKFYGDKMKGMDDQFYKRGYDKVLVPKLQDIRSAFAKYHTEQQTARNEGNATFLVERLFKDYSSADPYIPDEALDEARKKANAAGITNARFNDILMQAAERRGAEGDPFVFDILKRPRADGTPGMYFIPKYKEAIDRAQIAAEKLYTANSERDLKRAKELRDDAQDKAMLPIIQQLMGGDTKGAQLAFEKLRGSGIFSSATELDKYRKLFDSNAKSAETAEQEEREAEMMIGVLNGKISDRDVLDADLTPTQKRRLIADAARRRSEERTLAAQARAQAATERAARMSAIEANKAYLGSILAVPSAPGMPPSAAATRLRSTALLEYSQRVGRGEDPADVVRGLQDRYIKRVDELRTVEDFSDPRSLLRYGSANELADAYERGELSREEFQSQRDILKKLQSNPKK